MVKELCDICKENDANVKFKIKRARRGMWIGSSFNKEYWKPYETIEICDKCANKHFNIKEKI